jgi:tetratricopeptide (TPR) repeat protein
MIAAAALLLLQLTTGTASDLAQPQRFQLKGKVVVGLDEPVLTIVNLRDIGGSIINSTQSFANGTFRLNNVQLGTYWISIEDSRFNLYEDRLLLREPGDTARELVIRLTRLGEGAAVPELNAALYEIDAESLKKTAPKAVEHYNAGVNALRNPAKNNPPDAHFKRAVSADPKFYEAHLQLGLVLRRLRKSGDAIQELERAVELRSADARARRALGELYLDEQKADKVLSILSAIEPENLEPRDHYLLGSAEYRLNHLERAVQELLAAINEGDDKDPAPFLQLHNVFMKKREGLPALAVLDDYLKLFPNDSNHAAMLERAKQLRQALKLPPGF